MILYEVRLEVDPAIAAEYREWLAGHVREIIALPGFVRADILREPRDSGRIGLCAQYWLVDRNALDNYLRDHAPRLRADAMRRFPDGFTAARRVLELDQSIARD